MRLFKKLCAALLPAAASPTTREIGAAHEHSAAAWLAAHGYEIEAENFATRYGEVDIIARERSSIVFIEVRFRSSAAYGTAAETVTVKKQQRIAKAALSYLKMKKIVGLDVRFDVIAMGPAGVIDHIVSAFVPRGYYY